MDPATGPFAVQAWPRITVITPSLDQGRFLEAALRSVLLQRYPNLEYIVMDGGSSDGSVATRYAPWLTAWTSESDRGQYDALNKGFRRATGDILAWLNSDDMYCPNALQTAAAVFVVFRDELDWLTGACGVWDTRDVYHPSPWSVRRYTRCLVRRGWHEPRLLGEIQQESTFWTRRLWDRAGGRLRDDLGYAADFELWCRFARHAALHTVSAHLAGFRVHPEQKTATGLDGYCAEIDRVVGRVGIRRVGRLLGLPRLTALYRIAAEILRPGAVLGFDARSGSWRRS